MRKLLLVFLIFFQISLQAEEIKIGVILGLTGPAHLWANQGIKGLELAKDEINNQGGINGKQVKLIIEDSKTDGKTAVTAFNKLVYKDKVSAIIGGSWDLDSLPIADLARREKVLIVTPGVFDNGMPKDNQFFFSTAPRISSLKNPIEKFFSINNQLKEVVIFCPDNAWGESYVKVYKQVLSNNKNIQFSEIRYGTNFNFDFKIEALKIKTKRFREINFKPLILTTSEIIEPIKIRNFSLDKLDGIFYTDFQANIDFQNKFKNKFNIDPFFEPQNLYEALRGIAKALEVDSKKPWELIKSVSYDGVSGKIDFSSQSANFGDASLFKIENNSIKEIK